MNNINGKRFFRENANRRENSNKQRENLHESRVLQAAGKTPRLTEKLFKLDQEKDGYFSYSFEQQPKRIYHTVKARTRQNYSRLYGSKTSVQLKENFTPKDYVFREIIGNERLNSYGE